MFYAKLKRFRYRYFDIAPMIRIFKYNPFRFSAIRIKKKKKKEEKEKNKRFVSSNDDLQLFIIASEKKKMYHRFYFDYIFSNTFFFKQLKTNR